MILMDEAQERCARLLSLATAEVRAWHGNQAKKVRASDEARTFYKSLAEGSWVQHLSRTFEKLSDATFLEGLLFTVDTGSDNRASDETKSEENGWAATVAHYICSLVQRRVRSFSYWSESYPEKFIGCCTIVDGARRIRRCPFCLVSFHWVRAGRTSSMILALSHFITSPQHISLPRCKLTQS